MRLLQPVPADNQYYLSDNRLLPLEPSVRRIALMKMPVYPHLCARYA